MKCDLLIKAYATPGQYIGHTLEEAQKLADHLGCWVEVYHNDKRHLVVPTPTEPQR